MVDDVEGGGGTKVDWDCLLGSSKTGAGKTGFDVTLPVPEGPPLPTRRLALEPPVAAAAICCCRAKTSRPLVTYPASISCFVKVSSASPIQCK